jgi:uncharacterized membrane protein YhaH (DUF805 family)
MGAFEELFGFEGRITRLGFLWRNLAVGLGMGVMALGGRILLETAVRPMGLGGYDAGARGLGVAIALIAVWSSVAIACRRLRDLGLEPVHVVPIYLAVWAVSTAMLHPLIRMQPASYGLFTACWAMLLTVPTLSLLLLPSRAAPIQLAAEFKPSQPTAYMNWRG